MSDHLKKAQPGQRLDIPAKAYNSFIDAAVDYQRRASSLAQGAERAFRQADIILVKNATGSDQNRFAVLGIDVPVITPAENEDQFKNQVAMCGILPDEDQHIGRFVVLAEPLRDGAIGRGYAAGVCPVRLSVPDYHDYRLAEMTNAVTGYLTAGFHGSAGILWREGGTGEQWAVVRLGKPLPMYVFPVNLTQVGGYQGTESAPATWTYDVKDVTTGEELAAGVSPVAAPHKWQRPSVGWMIAATFGYAHYSASGQLVLGWINEMPDQEACGSY